MTAGLFLAWIVVMALGLAAYVWLVVLVVRARTVPHHEKWSVLLPPLACWVAVRAGGWPRAAAIVFALLFVLYGVLRVLA